jgi:glycosyltransferase involved in cell wall biosynthesis
MRILYIITKSEVGGAQRHVLQLIRGMRERGHVIGLMCHPGGWLVQEAEKLGVTVYPNAHFKNSYNPLHALRTIRSIARGVAAFKPDLVTLHSSSAGFLSRMAIRNKIPTVFTAHSWAFTDGSPRFRRIVAIITEKLAAPFASKIICVSKYDVELARRYHIVPARKLIAIYNGTEIEPLPVKQASEMVKLLFVGRLAYPKRTDLLIDSFAALPDTVRAKTTLTIVGDGPQKESLIQRVKSKKLTDHILFRSIAPSEVSAYFRDADIFVLLSKHEGFPMTILEAMAAGVPVIASKVGGIPEEIDSTCGVLVPNNVAAVSAAFTTLITDPSKRLSMGTAAYERAATLFSVERFISETEKVYDSVIASK